MISIKHFLSIIGFLLLLLSINSVSMLHALDLSGLNHTVRVSEETGQYILFGRLWGSNENQPLLNPGIPYSSYITIKKGNNDLIRLNRSELKPVIVKSPDSVSITWTMDSFIITEMITIRKESGSAENYEYLRHDITVQNKGEADSFEIRILLDIYRNGDEFLMTPDGSFIGSEHIFQKKDLPDFLYWGTPGETGHYLNFPNKAKDSPDKILVSGWTRFDNAEWIFPVEEGRVFYSFPNPEIDAAVAMYYSLGKIKGNGKATITYFTGMDSDLSKPVENIVLSQDSDKDKAVGALGQVGSKEKKTDSADTYKLFVLESRLSEIDDFLLRIDRKLAGGEAITDEELIRYEQFLKVLEDRKEEYAELR